MNNNFFTLNDKQYVVFFEDSKMKLLKKENDNLILLNEEETKEIISNLNIKNGYQYDSNKLLEIINSNNDLDNKEYLYNFLQWLENIIPLDSRENFYNNLKTLKTNLNLNIDFSKIVNEFSEGYEDVAGYNTKENSLRINKKSILETWNIAKSVENSEEFFWKSYAQTLLHELAHMASSVYNPETGISLCGFDKYPPEKAADRNRGLTEGFTEIISMAGVPGTIEIASGYYIEASLINQLIQIIGLDVFLKSYFSNLGTALLEKELCNIVYDQNQAFELFRFIELNFSIRDFKGKQNILGNLQLTLLDYLEKKCEKLIENNNIDIIQNMLKVYEQMMITPEKLTIMKKNPADYEGISESIQKFKKLQEKFTYSYAGMETTSSIGK